MQSGATLQAPGGVLVDRLVPGRIVESWFGTVLLVASAVVLVAVAAQVRVPLPFTPVPLTGQTFAVLLVGASLGAWRAVAALALYVAVGILGVPVFNGWAAGVSHLLGPTGGYLLGFIAAAGLLGALAERNVDRRFLTALPAMLAAGLVIYGFGTMGLIAVGMSLPDAVTAGVLPFVVGDLIKATLAAALLPGAWSLVRRLEDR